jgi:Lar family restriction alleviation protein
MKKDTLKSCPYCGGSEIHSRDAEEVGVQFYCADCLACGPVARVEAFAACLWNQRHAAALVVEVFEKAMRRKK